MRLLVARPPSMSEGVHNVAINWLNDDILLSIFNCYRLNENIVWNKRLGWCKLTHVCQRWRHLIHEFKSHLGMHMQCTNGTPIVDTLNHLPPLPLLVDYTNAMAEQDEFGVYHALRLHNRVREIYLDLPPSILHKCLVLMDRHFPMLDRLKIVVDKITTTAFPSNAFLASNLRYLGLFDIRHAEILQLLTRLLTSTVSLVTLTLKYIQIYIHPTLLVARLSSLPQLKELTIGFRISIPRPSAGSDFLGEEGTPMTLPNLKYFHFTGDTAYLESLVSHIRAPDLEFLDLDIPLFDPFTLPHLSHFLNIAVGSRFEPHTARVHFHRHEVCIFTTHSNLSSPDGFFLLRVKRYQLDRRIDAQLRSASRLSPRCAV
jgi:hypothetical protein